MRRWLVVFLLVLLPAQFSWAAAAAYCSHESDPAAKHFGHHVHVHKAGAKAGDTGKLKADKSVPDADCPVCNLAAPAVAFDLVLPALRQAHPAQVPMERTLHPSAVTDQPERPNWQLAA